MTTNPVLPKLPLPTDAENVEWFGHVYSTSSPSGTRLGQVRPLAARPRRDGPWHVVPGARLEKVPVDATKDAFPTRGTFFSIALPEAYPDGSYVTFRVERNPKDDKDHYLVLNASVDAAVQVVDVGEGGFSPGLRDALARGAWRAPYPIFGEVLFKDGETAFGPVALMKTADGYQIATVGSKTPEAEVRPGFGAAHASLVDTIYGPVLLAHPPLPTKAGSVFVESDLEAARLLINRFLNLDQKAATATGVFRKAYKEYVDVVGAHVFGPREQDAAVRTKHYAAHVRELLTRVVAYEEVRDELLKLLAAQPELETGLAVVRARAEAEARAAVETELSETFANVAAAKSELAAAEARRKELEEGHADRVRELGLEFDAHEAAALGRLREIAASPERLFAEAVGARALSVLTSGPRLSPADEGSGDEDRGSRVLPDVKTLNDLAAALKRLRASLETSGFVPSAGDALVGALLALRVPVVTGPYASDLVHAFADTFCGGAVAWASAHYAPAEPDGWLRTPLGPASEWGPFATVADLIADARVHDRLFLVAIDGVDRAPAESFASPVFRCFADDRRRLVLPTSRGTVSEAWPANVLLVTTAELGATTFPLSPAAWVHGALVPGPWARSERSPSPGSRALTPAAWYAAVEGAQAAVASLGAVPPWLVDADADGLVLRETLASMALGRDGPTAERDAFVAAVLPVLAARGEAEVASRLALGGFPDEVAARLVSLAKRLSLNATY